MKKVFLSLAIVAALTVVSCKQAEATTDETMDSTAVVVEEIADSATAVIDSVTTEATEAIEAAAPAK